MKCDFCGSECGISNFIDCTEEWLNNVTAGRWDFPVNHHWRTSKYFGGDMKEIVLCYSCMNRISPPELDRLEFQFIDAYLRRNT